MSSSRSPIDHRDFAAASLALRKGGLVDDRVFDGVYPPAIRRKSSVHWTPVEVAVRVAELLSVRPTECILDIGSGVGKFCIVAASVLPTVRVRGVEHRAHFVEIAQRAADRFGVAAAFEHSGVGLLDPTGIDAVYMFNPFAENLARRADWIDDTVNVAEEHFWRDTESVEHFLAAARTGTRVVTYCGWGGVFPFGYERTLRESRAGTIEVWEKLHEAT